MKHVWRKMLLMCLGVTLLAEVILLPTHAAEDYYTTLQETIEAQVRAFADSIDQADADDNAAIALASHGISGGGRKLTAGKNHALTATLCNSELMQEGLSEMCAAAIEYMQKLDLVSLPYLASHFTWDGGSSVYGATVYTAAGREYKNMDAPAVKYTTYTGSRNGYDSSLNWMAGITAADLSFTRKKATQDEVTYTVTCVVWDRFDFDTSQGSGFSSLISGLSALLFREFDWESKVTFELKVPNRCTHSSGVYHWTYDSENQRMVSDTSAGYTENQATRLTVETSSGASEYYYELDQTVRLRHNKPWVLEYQTKNPGSIIFAPLKESNNTQPYLYNYGRYYIFADKKERIPLSDSEANNLGLSTTKQNRTHRYGTKLNTLFSYSATQLYTLRLENVPANDGTNMVWLTVYNQDLQETVLHVPMDDYYVLDSWKEDGNVLQSTEKNGISGRDFLINHIGNKTYRFYAGYFNLTIWENGVDGGNGDYYTSTVTAPTCEARGYTTHTCSLCSYSYKDTYTPKTNHTYGAWGESTPPTCTEPGTETRECTACNHAETRETPAIGHNYTTVVAAPTCVEQGYSTHTCANCGDSYTDNYVDATGHNYQSLVTAPTFETEGFTTYTCTVCHHSYTDNQVPALTCVATIGGKKFETLSEALAEAVEGDVIQLTADTDEQGNTLIVRPGVTLHLGAYDLIADGFIGFNGSILDATRYSATGDYGKLIVPKENLVLSGGQAAVNGEYDVIPVWNGEDAYILANALVNDTEGEYGLKIDEENKTIRFSFVHKVGGSANNAFFKDGTGDNALKIIIRLEWASGNGVAYQDFVYNDDFVGLVSGGGYNYSFILNNYDILNIDLSNLKVTAMILTDAGTITTGQVWTQANAIE